MADKPRMIKHEKTFTTRDSGEIIKQIRGLITKPSDKLHELVETFELGENGEPAPLLEQIQFVHKLMFTRYSNDRETNVTLRAPWIIMEYFYGDRKISFYDQLVIMGAIFHRLKIESWIRLVKVASNHHNYAYYTIPSTQSELVDDTYFSLCPGLEKFDAEPENYTDPIMIRMT